MCPGKQIWADESPTEDTTHTNDDPEMQEIAEKRTEFMDNVETSSPVSSTFTTYVGISPIYDTPPLKAPYSPKIIAY